MWSLFEVLIDPDEGSDSINKKINSIILGKKPKNPIEIILKLKEIQGIDIKYHGELPVESWLSIYPDEEDLIMLTPINFEVFLDSDGCREYRNKVRDFVKNMEKPLMIGIDHSMSGGVIDELSNRFNDLTLMVFDSHFDGIPSPIRNNLISYMMENESNYEAYGYKAKDYVFSPIGRKNSYNSGSFLYHLFYEGIIEKIIVFGPMDYPSEKLEKIKDSRVREFVDQYKTLEKEGIKIIHRRIIDSLGVEEAIKSILSYLSNNVYISIDIDIGARKALYGSKFLNVEGLKEVEIYKALLLIFEKNVNIIGLDIMEIDPWNAENDRTYNICGNIIRLLTDGTIYLDEKYKKCLENLDNIKDREKLKELINMGFIELSGKHFKLSYNGKII
ncbi:MAG: arginase family protein [Candidatus Methanomethylicia archaeon]|nr:arginase family protein [Candidatus Methanomethylicia archaeon]